jgi:hypothetical protein
MFVRKDANICLATGYHIPEDSHRLVTDARTSSLTESVRNTRTPSLVEEASFRNCAGEGHQQITAAQIRRCEACERPTFHGAHTNGGALRTTFSMHSLPEDVGR